MEILPRLTEAEQQTFAALEATIAANEQATMVYLDCLTKIRDQRLYRDHYQTWEAYCDAKWEKSCRAINLAISANKVRKQLATTTFGKRASQITDRTALALKRVEQNQRAKVAKKAHKLAGNKPISPTHIAKATRSFGCTTEKPIDTSIYVQQKSPTIDLPTSPLPSNTSTQPQPPITDRASAIAAIEHCYLSHKPWFNDLYSGLPRTPRDIIDHLIKNLA